MADMNIELARHNLIEQQIRPWDVLDNGVLETVMRCPREAFVAPAQHNLAFADIELPIGHGEAMMYPKVEARMLQAVQIQPDDRILEIGTGSGYVTMLLANMGAHVTSVEINEELALAARQRLRHQGIDNAEVKIGDGATGWSQNQPYDVIVITGSLPSLPETFKGNMQIGGRLFVVVGEAPIMQARLVTRTNVNEWREEMLFDTLLRPLIHTLSTTSFQF